MTILLAGASSFGGTPGLFGQNNFGLA